MFVVLMPIICVAGYNKDTGFGETWHRYLLSYFIGVLIFVFFTAVLPINNRLCNYLGRISYSIYLFHSVIILLMQRFIDPLSLDIPGNLYIAIVLIATVALSAITYELIEKPFLNIASKLRGKMNSTLAEETIKIGAL
jgi:peptidoglycan/LPS O-acetylase OafA/YrhL